MFACENLDCSRYVRKYEKSLVDSKQPARVNAMTLLSICLRTLDESFEKERKRKRKKDKNIPRVDS